MPSESLWLGNKMSRFPTLTDSEKASAVIIGGGIAGLTTAYYLAKSGVKVIVAEAGEIGMGISGHTTAHVTSQHDITYGRWIKRFGEDAARLIARANEEAIREISNISVAENIECDFNWKNSYLFTNDRKKIQKLIDEKNAAEKLGIKASVAEKGLAPFSYLEALVYSNQADFNPTKYMNGLADAIVKYGGKIYENSRILHIDGNRVFSQGGSITADDIVIATHMPIINFPGMYFAKAYQDRAYVIAAENAPQIDGMWASVDKGGHTYRSYGDYLLICGEDHKCGTKRNINHYRNLYDFAENMFGGSKISYQWSAQDVITLDKLPYIGKYSKKSDHLFVATGFAKWGMTQSNIAGRIISDLIIGNKNPYADIYSPQRRLKPSAFFSSIYINAAVAGHYFTGLFRLKCPRCVHLKCGLVWNKDEMTWDCPCHGSRFKENGSVIDTPSIHDLKRKNRT